MGIKAGWQSALYLAYEYNLGNPGTSPTYSLWPSDEPDALTLGETPIVRRPIYGHALDRAGLFVRATQAPGGAIGAIPMGFKDDGYHWPLLYLMRNHFQHSLKSTDALGITQNFYAQDTAQPTRWSGYSMVRDWNVTQLTSFTGGVIDTLVISWAQAKPCVMLKPTLKFLSGASGVQPVSIQSSPPVFRPVVSGNIGVYLAGTAIHPAGFTITSKRNIIDQVSPSTAGRQGFALGNYQCDIQLQMWIDDDFFSRFQDTFATGAVQKLEFFFDAPGDTPPPTGYHNCTITTFVTPQNFAPMNLKKGAGIETVNLSCVSTPPPASEVPIMVSVRTLCDQSQI